MIYIAKYPFEITFYVLLLDLKSKLQTFKNQSNFVSVSNFNKHSSQLPNSSSGLFKSILSGIIWICILTSQSIDIKLTSILSSDSVQIVYFNCSFVNCSK